MIGGWRYRECREYQHLERRNDPFSSPEHATDGGNRLDKRHDKRHKHALRPGLRNQLANAYTDANSDTNADSNGDCYTNAYAYTRNDPGARHISAPESDALGNSLRWQYLGR